MHLAPLAFLAGILSITSPCILPLLPGYLSFVSGASTGAPSRKKVVASALLFVAGFTLIFTALGAGASVVGQFLVVRQSVIEKVAGVFVVAMGLVMLGVIRIPWLQAEKRMDLRRIKSGPAGAFPLGMAFAVGWTPCIGPVLSTVLSAAFAFDTATTGAALLAIYSLGLGVPLILLALLYNKATNAFDFLKRHTAKIEKAAGVLLIVMGILLFTGRWTRLFTPVLKLFQNIGWPPI